MTDPLKTWKRSPIDHVSLDKRDGYTEAAQVMFLATDNSWALWTVVTSNDKRTVRINAIRHVLHALPYDGKDAQIAMPPDPAVAGSPSEFFSTGRSPD